MAIDADHHWQIVRPHYQLSSLDLADQPPGEQLPFEYTIYHLINGQAQLTLNESSQPLAASSQPLAPSGFALLVPSKAYRLTAISTASRALIIRLKNELIAQLAEQLGLDWLGESFFLQQVAEIPALARLCQQLIDEVEQPRPGQSVMLDALINQFVINLLRDWLAVRRNPQLELSRVGMVDRRLRRAIEYIHSHYHQELALAEIAQAAFLSEYHFAHLFKRVTGLTPHQYLAAVRIEAAKQLIAESDLSIAAVSATVGYASQSHFTKIFRNLTGLTPAKYRERLRNPATI